MDPEGAGVDLGGRILGHPLLPPERRRVAGPPRGFQARWLAPHLPPLHHGAAGEGCRRHPDDPAVHNLESDARGDILPCEGGREAEQRPPTAHHLRALLLGRLDADYRGRLAGPRPRRLVRHGLKQLAGLGSTGPAALAGRRPRARATLGGPIWPASLRSTGGGQLPSAALHPAGDPPSGYPELPGGPAYEVHLGPAQFNGRRSVPATDPGASRHHPGGGAQAGGRTASPGAAGRPAGPPGPPPSGGGLTASRRFLWPRDALGTRSGSGWRPWRAPRVGHPGGSRRG